MVFLAKQTGPNPIKRKDISKAEQIPNSYLENILLQLRKNSLITTVRGAAGGFVLGRSPDKIKLIEIVELLEGPLAPVHCVLDANACERVKGCEAHILWSKLYEAEKKVLDSMTLQDLIHVRREEWVI
jgi:Rrf2 family transcriptional regulator, cysteine metabolism repressor